MNGLEKSIERWKENTKLVATGDWTEFLTGPEHCALCHLYHPDYVENYGGVGDCDGCPVKKATGKKFCDGTPYIKVCDARTVLRFTTERSKEGEALLIQDLLDACKEEVEFLEGLRDHYTA